MRTLSKWSDLIPYGIDPLTGEACGLMYRILCAVTTKGREIIRHCLDLPDLSLAAPWNQGSKDHPHIGSIMLAPEMFTPLAVFALLDNGCTQVWLCKGGALVGIEPADTEDALQANRRIAQAVRTFRYAGTAGSRNRHEMSGRIT